MKDIYKIQKSLAYLSNHSFIRIIFTCFCIVLSNCAKKSEDFLSHEQPFENKIRGSVVLIIDDMGMNHLISSRAIKLPPEVTLSYLPYALNLKKQVGNALQAGHEIMLHLPMEAYQATDQEKIPNILMVSMSPAELERKINWAFAQIPEFIGVNNHMGSRFTEWPEGMKILLSLLKKHGWFFLDSKTTSKSVASAIAKKINLPFIQRDIFIDDIQNEEVIYQQLAQIEKIALKRGYVVAIAHPHPQTLDILEKWLLTLPEKKLRLISVQVLLKEFQ